jgi:hypothetical protein
MEIGRFKYFNLSFFSLFLHFNLILFPSFSRSLISLFPRFLVLSFLLFFFLLPLFFPPLFPPLFPFPLPFPFPLGLNAAAGDLKRCIRLATAGARHNPRLGRELRGPTSVDEKAVIFGLLTDRRLRNGTGGDSANAVEVLRFLKY